MNKDKLIQIIVKDLEELKTFTEEVAESQDNSTLIVDLALSRTLLIGKEFEILRQFLLQADNLNDKTEVDVVNEDEEDNSDSSFSDPELEIINFEDPESDQLEIEEEEEEPIVYNSDEDELEEEELVDEEQEDDFDDNDNLSSEEEIEVEMEISNPDEDEPIIEEDDLEDEVEIDEDDLEDDFDDEDEDDLEEDEDEDELVAFEEKEAPQPAVHHEKEEKAASQPKPNVYMNELKFESQPGVREIHIEDLDDEQDEPIQFTPMASSTQRPVMHEIPKPEFTAPEKVVVAETFQKDRSLNDTIAENKSEESSLGNGPITSLKASIGLNDRFLFIREIFANNTDKYNLVIDQLDKLETIQQAVEFLKAQLTLQKNETSLKFVDLLKRRFSK